MGVTINIPSYMQYFTDGMETIEVDGKTLNDCLELLAERFPEMRKIMFDGQGKLYSQALSYISVFLNGTAVTKEELENRVNDGDEISLAQVILGG